MLIKRQMMAVNDNWLELELRPNCGFIANKVFSYFWMGGAYV